VVAEPRLGEECGPFIAAFAAELARRCPPGLAGDVAVVPGEFTDAERYGALAAADADAGLKSRPRLNLTRGRAPFFL
jgi:hypothetical protein